LPNSETELLLKRLTRDPELRESFGRYALIGDALRGPARGLLTKGFSARVNLAIDGEPAAIHGPVTQDRTPRWWRPLAGVAVAAGVAVVAVGALQHRTDPTAARVMSSVPAMSAAALQAPREAISYTVPAAFSGVPAAMPPARLTNYVFAHSRYSSGLDQRGVMADLLIENEEARPGISEAAAHVAP
jgi:negative regulator of sigma E activity